MQRLEALARALPAHADAFLLTSESNIFYFTGFPCDAAVVLATRDGSFFFTDSRYMEAAQRVVHGVTFCESTQFPTRFPQLAAEHGVRNLLVETSRITVREAQKFASLLPDTQLLYEDDAAFLGAFRRKKSADEADKMMRAQRIAEQAFTQILPQVQVGKTEKEIALELDYAMLRLGADALSFQTIVVGGENSSLPHGIPGERQFRAGDLITFDFGAVYRGYHSDMTRTVALGFCGDEQRNVYETVLRAQKAGIDAVRPGVACKDADAAARQVISDAGFGEYFGHGTGHGVGVEIHEKPTVNPRSREALSAGDVVTVEPGIYLPGKFGVRIEDMLLVTPDGHSNFTNTDKELRVLPI